MAVIRFFEGLIILTALGVVAVGIPVIVVLSVIALLQTI